MAGSLCWKLDSRYVCFQFNFQHFFFPAHTDGCGFPQRKLLGGDGFGNQIAVLQLKGGDTWVNIVGEVPHTESWLELSFE